MGARKPEVDVLRRVAIRAGVDPRSVRAAVLGRASPAVTRVVLEAIELEGLDPRELVPLAVAGRAPAVSATRTASDREHEAWEARYKHGKAARAWDDIALANEGTSKRPPSPHCRILAEWMAAYEAADAAAEKAFRALAATEMP